MGAIVSQITSLTIVFSTVYLDTDQRKHQRSASLAFGRKIHRRPVNSPHEWPVTRKMFPFDDVIMIMNQSPRQCRATYWQSDDNNGSIMFKITALYSTIGYDETSERRSTKFTNPRMHMPHIPQYTIQNRNVHISVLNGALCDMGQEHSGICELGLYHNHCVK